MEGREEHPPDGHDSSHQQVDREEKKSGYAEHAPGEERRKDEAGLLQGPVLGQRHSSMPTGTVAIQ